MKGSSINRVYHVKFIDFNDKEKVAKVSSPSLFGAKQLFNSRYKGKVKQFITIEEASK